MLPERVEREGNYSKAEKKQNGILRTVHTWNAVERQATGRPRRLELFECEMNMDARIDLPEFKSREFN